MRAEHRLKILLSAFSLMLISPTLLAKTDPAYFLVAGSFQEQTHAKERMAEITSFLHAPVSLKPITHDGKSMYLVKIDAHSDYPGAVALQKDLKKHGIDSVTLADPQNTKRMDETEPLPQTQSADQIKATVHHHAHPKEHVEKPVKRLWNLRNADLRAVIQEVSRETGKNFLIDPRVEGKISIVSANPMDAGQLYQVFLSMLEVSGFSALQDGRVTKIVPNVDAKTMNAPVFGERSLATHGEEVIVQVVPIKYVSAQQLVPIIRPMMPQWTALSAYIPSNSLILSGRASNLERMIKIIERVDVANTTSMEVVPLRNGTAADVVKTLSDLQQRQQPLGVTPIAIASDDRANAVILSGSSEQRLRVRALVSQLDVANPANSNDTTQVIYLQFMQAKDIAPILAGVARSHFRGDVGITIGTRTQDKPPALDRNGSHSSEQSDDAAPAQTPDSPTTAASNTTQKGQESGHPHVEIIAEPNTNTIILNAPPTLMNTLKTVVAKLDIRPMQVAVEALIAEINEDDVVDLGIDWGTRDNQFLSGSNTLGSFNAGFGLIRKGGFSDFELQLHALANNNKADILSTPSVVVLDNHLAHIKVGKEVSVKESDYPGNANGGAPATPYNTFRRVPVALVLNVTPQITHDGSIKLLISHQNNTLQNANAIGDSPIFNISEISTSVIVANGDILVLGGLIQNQLRDEDSRIPIVGDFPGLGKVFHHTNKSHFKKKLMVFLRPIILQNQETNIQVSGSKYEAIRDAQLQEIRERGYTDEYKEHVLPNYQKPLVLPKPFLHHTPRA